MVESISQGDKTYAEIWASYISNTDFNDFPAEVVTKTKLCILDTIGAMLAGTQARSPRIAREVVLSKGGRSEATILGFGDRVPCLDAGFVNGIMAHCLELDDGHRPSDNHLGCVVVPAALVAAEYANANGKDFVTSVVLGYDAMGKIGEAVVLPRIPRPPWHGTGTCGPFGSVAAADKLFHLNEDQIVNSFGIAGTSAAGLKEVMVGGTHCKAFHAGKAVESGLLATFLAQKGFTGPRTVIEGSTGGFCVAHSGEPHPEKSIEGLGKVFDVTRSQFKIRASCGISFNAVDATLELVSEHDIKPGDVEQIIVEVPTYVLEDHVFRNTEPKTEPAAKFSVPYAVAVSVIDRAAFIKQFSLERILAPDVRSMLGRVRMVSDPEIDRKVKETASDSYYFHVEGVTIQTKDGARYHSVVEQPRGYSPKKPLTEGEVKTKFREMANGLLQDEEKEEIIDLVLDLEHVGSIRDLVRDVLVLPKDALVSAVAIT